MVEESSVAKSAKIDALVRKYGKYRPDELWTALSTAASSPSGRHRLPSIIAAISTYFQVDTSNTVEWGDPYADIELLVDMAAEACGISEEHEDYVPLDPTLLASVKIGDHVRTLVPGRTSRPISDLSRASRFAEVADSRISEILGFGVSNILKVTTSYMDLCVRALLPNWEPAPDLKVGDRLLIPDTEFVAYHLLNQIDPLELLNLDERDIRALQWMTARSPGQFSTALTDYAVVNRYLRVPTSDWSTELRWLPPSLVPEVLMHAVHDLLGEVMHHQGVRQDIRRACIEDARRSFWKFSQILVEADLGPEDTLAPLDGTYVNWLIPVESDVIIAVSLLLLEDLSEVRRDTIACVDLVTSITRLKDHETTLEVSLYGDLSLSIPTTATIVPLVVVASTSHTNVVQSSGFATVSLEDLDWIANDFDSHHDLYRFSRDLASLDSDRHFGMEGIDYWKLWNGQGKTFARAEADKAFLLAAPHTGELEWLKVASLNRVEEAFHSLGLPSLRRAERVKVVAENIAAVSYFGPHSTYADELALHHSPPRINWFVSLIQPPIAVAVCDPTQTDEAWRFQFLLDFGASLVTALTGLESAWTRAHAESFTGGYQILTAAAPDNKDAKQAPIENRTLSGSDDSSVITAHWQLNPSQFAQACAVDPNASIHLTLGPLQEIFNLTDIGKPSIDSLIRSWSETDPFFVVRSDRDGYPPRPSLPPIVPDQADISKIRLALGEKLKKTNPLPGKHRGKAANKIIQRDMAPTALAQLRQLIAKYDRTSLIIQGMKQLSRVSRNHIGEHTESAMIAEHLTVSSNTLERLNSVGQESFTLRQWNEMIVESALILDTPRQKTNRIGNLDWSELLAGAESYWTTTLLSERQHWGILPIVVTFDDLGNAKVSNDLDGDYDQWMVDTEAFFRDRIALALQSSDKFEESVEYGTSQLDQAMLNDFGTTPTDIQLVLHALVELSDPEHNKDVVLATSQEVADLIQAAYALIKSPDHERGFRALGLLTLASDDLKSEDWRPWQTRTRRNRLITRPIVQLDHDHLVFSPPYLLTSARMYRNYLFQGMLPWSHPPTRALSAALANIRSARNLAFERDLEGQLKARGYSVISRVKPQDHARLGVPKISGEIDLVCGNNESEEIWLVEAKDLATVHGVPETSRQLRSFFAEDNRPTFASRLQQKEEELSPYVRELELKLGLQALSDGRKRTLRAVFVTRNLTYAGYVKSAAYSVYSAQQFLNLLGDTNP